MKVPVTGAREPDPVVVPRRGPEPVDWEQADRDVRTLARAAVGVLFSGLLAVALLPIKACEVTETRPVTARGTSSSGDLVGFTAGSADRESRNRWWLLSESRYGWHRCEVDEPSWREVRDGQQFTCAWRVTPRPAREVER